jgi:hypothetical protein
VTLALGSPIRVTESSCSSEVVATLPDSFVATNATLRETFVDDVVNTYCACGPAVIAPALPADLNATAWLLPGPMHLATAIHMR